jgi:hypothetical protein
LHESLPRLRRGFGRQTKRPPPECGGGPKRWKQRAHTDRSTRRASSTCRTLGVRARGSCEVLRQTGTMLVDALGVAAVRLPEVREAAVHPRSARIEPAIDRQTVALGDIHRTERTPSLMAASTSAQIAACSSLNLCQSASVYDVVRCAEILMFVVTACGRVRAHVACESNDIPSNPSLKKRRPIVPKFAT